MNNDAYEQLAQALDLLPGGFPRTKSDVELQILKRIFLPEEAFVASNMTGTSETVEAIAKRSELLEAEVEGRLQVMLVFNCKNNRYMLCSWAGGDEYAQELPYSSLF